MSFWIRGYGSNPDQATAPMLPAAVRLRLINWFSTVSSSNPARRQALGSQSFVESHFYNLKRKLGYKRRRPATRLTALGSAHTLWVFRDLRVRPIG